MKWIPWGDFIDSISWGDFTREFQEGLRVVHDLFMTASCHTYKWASSHVSVSPSHTCDMIESSHTHERVLSHVSVSPSRSCRTYEARLGHVTHITRVLSQVSVSPSHTCDMTHASHTYEWALSHVSVSPSRSSDWVMSHVWTQTESCRTYEARLSHVIRTNESFLMSLCLTVCYHIHIWWVGKRVNESSHRWTRHDTHMKESCPTWISRVPCHMNESCLCVSHPATTHIFDGSWNTQTSHGTHMNKSWHTYEWVMSLCLLPVSYHVHLWIFTQHNGRRTLRPSWNLSDTSWQGTYDIYMYVCVCVCVYMYIYIDIYVCTYMCVYIYM